MQFLIDASLPRAVVKLFPPRGHQAIDIRDIGLRRAPDADVAAHARRHQMALVSADFDSTAVEVVKLTEKFLSHDQIIANLSGHLVIVDRARIRVRPPLPTP